MSGWGTTITGLASTIDVLETIKMHWEGDTFYIVGPTVSYAVYNELGTSKMKARPFMRPAAERVQANPERYAREVGASQGINISTEAGFSRALALAVQNESKRIADTKDVRESGNLIASITIEQVS